VATVIDERIPPVAIGREPAPSLVGERAIDPTVDNSARRPALIREIAPDLGPVAWTWQQRLAHAQALRRSHGPTRWARLRRRLCPASHRGRGRCRACRELWICPSAMWSASIRALHSPGSPPGPRDTRPACGDPPETGPGTVADATRPDPRGSQSTRRESPRCEHDTVTRHH